MIRVNAAFQRLRQLSQGLARGVAMLAVLACSILVLSAGTARAAADPNQGPGGPILVVTSSSATFGKFYAEILRTEGFNEFSVVDVSAVTPTLLSSYDVVILARTPLTSGQASALSNWVTGGGNLIAMSPDAQLAGLLGISMTGGTLSNGYMLPNGSHAISQGIAATSMQFHGSASLYSLSGATSLATLYSTATLPTTNPAVTIAQVGSNGGQAAAFAYDLATSIVYTRQGNPAWVGQERDGITPRRSNDLFFGPAGSDPQANWIDLDKVAIPQADEQQRLLANMITLMNLDRKPLPRFWYFPKGHRAVAVLTGDDHANNGTQSQFERYKAASAAGCSIADWECVRATSYLWVGTPLSNSLAAAYEAEGFEVGLHINPVFANGGSGNSGQCADYTPASLESIYVEQMNQFAAEFPGIAAPSTMRHHCIVWSDWVTGAKVQLNHGMRLDTNYYYWPPGWVNNRPGHFTGSAMPMRFADLDGTLIDVYQVVTQMTDESGQTYPYTSNTLLSRAVGSDEQYGVYTVNAHTDAPVSPEGDAVVSSAQAYGVPVVSARQLLQWLDGRNASAFSNLIWNNGQLSFAISVGAGANNLRGMLPYYSQTGTLQTLTRNGVDVGLEVFSVKGVDYAQFVATAGAYVATYAVDSTPPAVIGRTPGSGATGVAADSNVTVSFSEPMDAATIGSGTIELRDAGGALVASTVTYSGSNSTATLNPNGPLTYGGNYSVTVRGGSTGQVVKDGSGNALAANVFWSFTIAAAPNCPCSTLPPSAMPALIDSGDTGSVELGVKFRTDISGYITGVRFYKSAANTGTHVGNLWTASGQLLASAVFSNESATGWQQVNFPVAVPVVANTVYVASYFAPNGRYSADNGYFATTGIDNPPLHLLSNSAAGGNGVYAYGSASSFPDSTYQSSNYYVDVSFVSGAPDTVNPVLGIATPTAAASYATSTATLTLGGTASDNVGVTQVTWTNSRGGSGSAAGTTSWSASGIALQSGDNLLTVTASDAMGNLGSDSLVVTYTPVADATPPQVTTTNPAAGATGVSPVAALTVTFNEPLDPATVTASTFELRNAANALLPTTATYSSTNNAVTVTPTAALASSSTFTLTVKGGAADPRVKDLAGNALAASFTLAFTTSATNCPCSVWSGTVVPGNAAEPDSTAVELGVKFRSDVNGTVTGVRFYKGATNTGTHVGNLWTASGQLLASAPFSGETASGWQQVNFASPVAITADTVYVVSYFAPNGNYAADGGYFTSQGADNGVLHMLQNGVSGGNGVYNYAATSSFPASTYNATNYWVDLAFVPDVVTPDTTAPTIVGRGPASGATGVVLGTAITVDFSEAMDVSTINGSTVALYDPNSQPVSATVSYSASARRATLVPAAALLASTTYTVMVRGGVSDPRVKDLAGNAMLGTSVWTFTTGTVSAGCSANAITAENCLTGNPASEWDISGAGDASIQGFATQISVNRGGAISFKVDTNATNYRFDIYRMGYYGGMGARKIQTVQPSASLPQNQPNCLTQAATGLIDCGNWAVSGSWTVPANATSGIYFAKVVRTDTGGASHIFFIVRNDASSSDLVFQTSDTTWQAYNNYGGNSFYQGSPGTNPARAYKVSYNRPFVTRGVDGGQDWVFNTEYPMVRWLEANGFDVSYISGVDTDRTGSLLLNHRAFLSVGHDEYWSGQQRANVEAARNAGVSLAFFSGNEVFWKTRWEASIDGSSTAYRTLVSYKETHAGAKIDPSAEWTGTWRDPRLSPPSDGGRPENALTGTAFTVNAGTSAIVVPAAEGKMRFWRNTTIAALTGSQTATLTAGSLGYEWDSDLDNGFRPAGLVRMSDTTVSGVDLLQDNGSSYASGTANHALTFYRHSSGAKVFGAGTIQWPWGLDNVHDRAGSPIDVRMQQATVNLFADMNVQPATLQSGLMTASMTTDSTAPTVVISAPAAGATLTQNVTITITGTASDVGGVVGGVEVSTDDGATWRRATGREAWSFSWRPTTAGAVTIRVRASDDSGNYDAAGTARAVTVGGGSVACPCSIWDAAQSPASAPDFDPASVELGTRFRASSNGLITAIRFYKHSANTGTHVGSLWSSSGALLGQVTFAGETASGWQQAPLPTPVAITANSWYVVSYHTDAGSYIGEDGYFATQGVANGPLYAPRDGEAGANGVYAYSSSAVFPTQTYNSEAYWVDVVFENTASGPDTVAPVVAIATPTSAATFSTTATTLTVDGTASDAVGVTLVTWVNSAGGSGTATGTTAWSAAAVPLVVGTNVVTVTARDAAGNTSTDVLTVTRTAADTTAPVIAIATPTSATTFSTTATTLTVGGTASDAVGVTLVTWVNSAGGSGSATGTTAWSAAAVPLVVGSNVVTVTARDAAGNTATDVLTVTRTAADTTAPAIAIATPTSATTFSTTATTLTVGGTASDAVGVTQVTWVNNLGGSGTATGTTAWSAAGVPLLVGSNIVTVTARDAAGNTSTDVLTITRTADAVAPVVAITTPTSATTFSTSATTRTVGGTASDANGINQVTWVNSAGGSGTATGTTSWSAANVALSVGANVITVTARDTAGNTSTDVITITRDSTAPVVTITGPTANTTHATRASTLALSGTASDSVGVTQVTWSNSRGGSGTASGTNSWSVASVALSSGSNVITVTARDAAGNTSTDVITVTRDNTSPTVVISGPVSSSTFSTTATTVNLSGTAADAVGVAQITWASNRGGSGTATGTTAWTAASVPLLTGSNILTVTVRDTAGNTGTDTLTVTRN